MVRERPAGFFDTVHAMVRRIPVGRVSTYGHVAALCGKPRAARTVGWALHALPEESDVPWQRVVNHRGGISVWKVGVPAELVVKKGAGHGWAGLDKDVAAFADWFDKHLKKDK